MAAEQTPGLSPESLTVFEARFGDKDGALVLLRFPLKMREFFLRLSDKADLPDSAPAGAAWNPFVRGWREDDYYIVSLTEADRTAARPGMIATRMLAAAVAEVEKWDDLNSLFETLQEPDRSYVSEVTITAKHTRSTQTVPTSVLSCVAYRLIHEDKTAAVVGQNGFEALVSTLWQKLPPSLRRSFRFGFSFTPTDLPVSRANIVAFPQSCEARWNNYKFKCSSDWTQPLTDSLAAFLNDKKAQGFLEFLQEVGLTFHTFSDYGRYARLWHYWQKRSENDLDVILALLRSLGTLLPEPSSAAPQKEEAMGIAAGLLQDSTEEKILALRSVKARSFPSKAAALECAVLRWIKLRIRSFQEHDGAALSKIVLALSSSQSEEWQDWIRKGLKQELVPLNTDRASVVWSILEEERALTEIDDLIPINASSEAALVQTYPANLPAKTYPALEKWCVARGWTQLMAQAALHHLGFTKAIDLVLNQTIGKSRAAAIELICAASKPSEVWQSAFRHAEPALFKCAVSAAFSDPTLWSKPDDNINRWVCLIESAAIADPNFLRNIDPTLITLRLFDAWANGTPVSEPICDSLQNAGRLEFTSCNSRSRLWPMIPKQYQAISRSNTLRAWLKDYYSQPPIKPTLEKELVEILFDAQNRDSTFPRNSPHVELGGLMLVEQFGGERDLEQWLVAVSACTKRLNADVAMRAGKLCLDHRWGNSAKFAKYNDERRARRDFRPIWEKYYDSLGPFEKFTFDIWGSFSRMPSSFQTSTDSDPMINAVFVTALPEEFLAIISHLNDCKELVENGTIYNVGKFKFSHSQCNVAVVQTGMGNSLSAAATERALSFFKPDFAFFVGIAGGLRDDLKIGDVVAANKVYGYESGKSGAFFQPRPDAPSVSHAAEQRANAVVRNETWQRRITPSPENMPKAIVRPIAAGEKVLVSESSEDMKRLKDTFTDAHAVAMEDLGFATAVRAHPSVCFAVVRGISDLIENKNEADRSGSHDIAAANAAAFAFEMLAGLVSGSRAIEKPFDPSFD